MTQMGMGDQGVAVFVFCWLAESRIERTEWIEKRPYFPAASNFFFCGWFFGLDGELLLGYLLWLYNR